MTHRVQIAGLLGDPTTIDAWLDAAMPHLGSDVTDRTRLHRECAIVLESITRAVASEGSVPGSGPSWQEVEQEVGRLTLARGGRGSASSSTARLMRALRQVGIGLDPDARLEFAHIVDELVIWAAQAKVERLAETIERQRSELEELQAPVIRVWDGIVAMPIVGTLDSVRAEAIVEALLNGITANDAEVAIMDITAVNTVDTLVADRLVRAATAARLMGADCVISGVGPHVAHTLVQLGVQIGDVRTTARLSGALAWAFSRVGLRVVPKEGGK